MAVTMRQSEIDEFLQRGHTLIFSTIGKDGFPHSTPVWYVYMDGCLYATALAHSQRAKNLQRHQKVSCLVEEGEHWKDLKAVMVRGEAEVLEDGEEMRRCLQLFEQKYQGFHEPPRSVPTRVQKHYAQPRLFYRVVPKKKIASWDNHKVRLVPQQ